MSFIYEMITNCCDFDLCSVDEEPTYSSVIQKSKLSETFKKNILFVNLPHDLITVGTYMRDYPNHDFFNNCTTFISQRFKYIKTTFHF